MNGRERERWGYGEAGGDDGDLFISGGCLSESDTHTHPFIRFLSEKNKKMMKGSLARHLHVHEISFMSSLPQNNNNHSQFHNFIDKEARDTSKSALSTSSFPSAKVLDFNADINVDEKDFILSQYFF
ncbi:hypothetical protein L1887_10282 [Cichorium endivia]|nr:hypothetical protein L1887_10282 [Cichorium endivia]